VHECQNLYVGLRHLIEQTISLNEELPDVGMVELGNYAAAFTVDVKRGSCQSRLRAGAAQPFPTHGPLNIFMGNGAPSDRVGLTALYRLEDIQVVQHVLNAAVIGQSIQERSHRLFRPHRYPPSTKLLP
jgi:hypothetical protein